MRYSPCASPKAIVTDSDSPEFALFIILISSLNLLIILRVLSVDPSLTTIYSNLTFLAADKTESIVSSM